MSSFKWGRTIFTFVSKAKKMKNAQVDDSNGEAMPETSSLQSPFNKPVMLVS
jgi:hypothetical protein